MTGMRIKEAVVSFEDYNYRAPMKFRATVVDRVTLLNVQVRSESNGKGWRYWIRVHDTGKCVGVPFDDSELRSDANRQ